METILIIIGICCIIAGFIGSILPVMPGPPLSYAGLLLLQWATAPFSVQFLILWAVIVAVIMALDYIIPSVSTKKFGGSPYGVWGSVVGLIAGIFIFPPFGFIVGPLIGAFLGELVGGKRSEQAFRAAWGAFYGLLLGTLLNVIAAGMMGYYFFANI